MDGLVPGRIVYYRDYDGVDMPGIVTRVWDQNSGTINLVTFPDRTNVPSETTERRTSVVFDSSETPKPLTWHWMFTGQATRHEPKPETTTHIEHAD